MKSEKKKEVTLRILKARYGRVDLPTMTEKQYQYPELQGLKFLAHIGLLRHGGGHSEAVFCLRTS